MKITKLSLTLAMNAALLAGMAAVVPPAFAQDQPATTADSASPHARHQPPSPDKVVSRLANKLNLTEDQKTQLLPIITERQQKMQELMSNSSIDRRQKRTQMKSIMQESDAKINGILNDQQKQQYAEFEKERREHMKEHRHQNQNQ